MVKLKLVAVITLVLGLSLACKPAKKAEPVPPASLETATASVPEPEVPLNPQLSAQSPENPVNYETPPEIQGINLPPEWPSDVPIMKEITDGGVIKSPKFLSFTGLGTVSPKEVEAFYSTLNGWKKAGSASESEGRIIFNMARENKILQVRITVQRSKTSLNLIYGDKDKVPAFG
jgi:hypothetical protein